MPRRPMRTVGRVRADGLEPLSGPAFFTHITVDTEARPTASTWRPSRYDAHPWQMRLTDYEAAWPPAD
jgi:hypothetical protein